MYIYIVTKKRNIATTNIVTIYKYIVTLYIYIVNIHIYKVVRCINSYYIFKKYMRVALNIYIYIYYNTYLFI